MFPIEEIATRSGLTKRTIRYYEEIGLLPPPERTSGGHRVYTEAHLKDLERIIFLKESLGLSLANLKEHFSVRQQVDALVPVVRLSVDAQEKRSHLHRIRDLLVRQNRLMDDQVAKLLEAREENRRLIARVDQGLQDLGEGPIDRP